uniref:(northern house mosquito) hypothetical protein n=1 Tax=Culex pipiens TaxID=7175 RepID=A0A8D8IU78_CULPI
MSKTSTTSYWVKQISFVLFALLFSLCYCFSLFLHLFFWVFSFSVALFFRKINCSRFQFIFIFVVYCLSKICISVFVLCFCFVFSCCNGSLIDWSNNDSGRRRFGFRAELPWDLIWQTQSTDV